MEALPCRSGPLISTFREFPKCRSVAVAVKDGIILMFRELSKRQSFPVLVQVGEIVDWEIPE